MLNLRPAIALLALLSLTIALVACAGEPASTDTPSPTSTYVPPPTPTEAPRPTPEPSTGPTMTPRPLNTPTPEQDAIATLTIAIDIDTTWQDIYDVLTPDEQECIQVEFPERMDTVLDYQLFNHEPGKTHVLLYECLQLPTARGLFLDGMVAQWTDLLEPDEGQKDCIKEVVAGVDPVAIMRTYARYFDDMGIEENIGLMDFQIALYHCFPEMIAGMIVYDFDPEEKEFECLLDVISEADYGLITLLVLDPETRDSLKREGLEELTGAMRACHPDIEFWYEREAYLAAVGDDHENDIGGATRFSVGEVVHGDLEYEGDMDAFYFRAEAGSTYLIKATPVTLDGVAFDIETQSRWIGGAHDYSEIGVDSYTYFAAENNEDHFVRIYGHPTGTYTFEVTPEILDDDHADFANDATHIAVGVTQAGKLDYHGDADFFWLEAEEGVIYQFATGEEPSVDTSLTLYDSQGGWLAESDDYHTQRFSRVAWLAESADDYFVAVRGYDIGRYALTVTKLEDDHGNYSETATPVNVGTPAPGDLEYSNDLDMFSFQAESGKIYRISVELGTLWDSRIELIDVGDTHAFNDDFGDSLASLVEWEAPASGEYFAIVTGYGPGTYTLNLEGWLPWNHDGRNRIQENR